MKLHFCMSVMTCEMKYILIFQMSNQLKLLFVGDHLCGKTSFIMTEVTNFFPGLYIPVVLDSEYIKKNYCR